MFKSSSKLVYSEKEKINGYSFIKIKNFPEVPRRTDDSFYSFRTYDRLDKISNRYYGTPDYNWFIALANNIFWEYSLVAGDILRIPSLISLSEYKLLLKNA